MMKINAITTVLLVAALVENGIAVPFTDGTDNSDELDVFTDDYLQKIRKQLDNAHSSEQTARNSDSAIITHGSTIALQPLYDKRNWLGCSGAACGKEACPNLYMEGDDWNKCMGQVFEIYHMCGPGEIKVGEAVGIYYPKEKNWFGCAGANCGKAGCPGKQSAQYGFENLGKWLGCWGEVFEIYARGKNPGEPITAHDDVILYYPRAADYVGLGNQAGHAGCPGKVQPPPKERYDVCWGEIFEIYLKADDSVFVQTDPEYMY